MKLSKIICSVVIFLMLVSAGADSLAQSNRRSTRDSYNAGSSTRGSSSRDRSFSNRSARSSRSEPSQQPQQPLPPLSDEAQAALNQFELTRTKLASNKREVDRMYRTVPIGFVEKQQQHMLKIKQIEAETEVLEKRIVKEAVDLFRLAPTRNRFATTMVLEQVGEALTPKSPESHFNPKLALEICSLMLAEVDLPWEILIRAFRASYALQDFERARMILDRLEQIGTLKPVYYELLEKTNQKWQDELLIRRLEDQTGDLPIATFNTTEGTFEVELFENQAPLTVNNFVALAQEGFYDGRAFYKVVPGEYSQSGCPNDNGTGSIGYTVQGEGANETARSHFAGTLTMTPNGQGNTGGNFLICHQPKTELDGRFTAFGRVTSEQGLDVVYKLNTHDATKFQSLKTSPSRILTVTIANKRSHKYVKTPVGSVISAVSGQAQDDASKDDAEYSPSSFDLLRQNN